MGWGRHYTSRRVLVNGEAAIVGLARDGSQLVTKLDAERMVYSAPTAAAKNGVVSSVPARLIALQGHSEHTENLYLLLFDSTSVPADAVVAKHTILIPSKTPFAVRFVDERLDFETGISWAISSTPIAKTQINSNLMCLHFWHET